MKTRTLASEWLSRLVNGVLVVCALLVTGLVVRQEISPAQAAVETSYYPEWRQLITSGNRVGEASAPVQMVVFYDYQCPFCRSVEPTIEKLMAKYQDQLAVVYRHFLLEDIHPQARAAALAVECGAEQNRFSEFHGILFKNASQLGKLPWEGLAAEAGVPDLSEFELCFRSSRHNGRIADDRSAVALVGISAIPGLIINGTVVTGAKPFEVLDGVVREALEQLD